MYDLVRVLAGAGVDHHPSRSLSLAHFHPRFAWSQPNLHAITNTSNDSTGERTSCSDLAAAVSLTGGPTPVIDFFRQLIASPAENGVTSIGMDECGDLAGDRWGHIPGDIPGVRKMTLAAEGFRQAKAAHPDLFVAACE